MDLVLTCHMWVTESFLCGGLGCGSLGLLGNVMMIKFGTEICLTWCHKHFHAVAMYACQQRVSIASNRKRKEGTEADGQRKAGERTPVWAVSHYIPPQMDNVCVCVCVGSLYIDKHQKPQLYTVFLCPQWTSLCFSPVSPPFQFPSSTLFDASKVMRISQLNWLTYVGNTPYLHRCSPRSLAVR